MKKDEFPIGFIILVVIVLAAAWYNSENRKKENTYKNPSSYAQEALEMYDDDFSYVYQQGFMHGYDAAMETVETWIKSTGVYDEIWEAGCAFGYSEGLAYAAD